MAAQQIPERAYARLDTCEVIWRLLRVGVSRDELRKGLELAPEFMSNANTIMCNKSIKVERFDELLRFLKQDE